MVLTKDEDGQITFLNKIREYVYGLDALCVEVTQCLSNYLCNIKQVFNSIC